jgi:hypothetical protein
MAMRRKAGWKPALRSSKNFPHLFSVRKTQVNRDFCADITGRSLPVLRLIFRLFFRLISACYLSIICTVFSGVSRRARRPPRANSERSIPDVFQRQAKWRRHFLVHVMFYRSIKPNRSFCQPIRSVVDLYITMTA